MGTNLGAWRDTIEIQPRESLESIAIRLAPKGRLSVPQLLKYGLGMQVDVLPALHSDQDAIARLAVLGSFDPDDLNMRRWSLKNGGVFWFGRDLPENWLTPHKRRVAPGRLMTDAERPYYRATWQLNVFGCDLETGEYLVENCPRCQVELSWIGACTVYNCQGCGFDLREIAPEFVQSPDLHIAQRFFSFYCGDFELPAPFDKMADRSIFHAMEWLAYFTTIWNGPYLSSDVRNALVGFEALERWPAPFDFMVQKFLRNDMRTITRNWRESALVPAWAVLNLIGEARTQELHDALTARAMLLFGDKYTPKSRSVSERVGVSVYWFKEALRRRASASFIPLDEK